MYARAGIQFYANTFDIRVDSLAEIEEIYIHLRLK